jgi:hypothetical protein
MIFGKKLILFFKNNFTRINHCKFIHHRSHLKPFLSYLPCIVRREYFSIIFHVKKCILYSIKYDNFGISKKLLHNLNFKSKKMCKNVFGYHKCMGVIHKLFNKLLFVQMCWEQKWLGLLMLDFVFKKCGAIFTALYFLRVGSRLDPTIRLGWKALLGTNTLAFWALFVS